MKPVMFPESNSVLGPPEGWSEDLPACGSLPIYTDGSVCASCWTMTLGERIKLLLTGRLWVMVHSGHTQPPISFSIESTVFTPGEDE